MKRYEQTFEAAEIADALHIYGLTDRPDWWRDEERIQIQLHPIQNGSQRDPITTGLKIVWLLPDLPPE